MMQEESGDGQLPASSLLQPRKNIIRDVCIFILVMELAERLCFYTFSGSMPIFLRDYLGFDQASASAMNSVFNTLVYLTPLIGGYVADSMLGRYWTIAWFGLLYFVGTALMAFSAYPRNTISWLFMVSFFGLVSMGAGGIKSNVVTMGGDQFNMSMPEEVEQKDSYFIYFYWVINIGALISYFVLAQMATEPTSFGLPEGWGFFYTFLLASLSLFLALVSFFSASGRYIYKPPSGSATADYVREVLRQSKSSFKGKLLVLGTVVLFFGVMVGIAQPFTTGTLPATLSYVAFVCAVLGIIMVLVPTTGLQDWIKGNQAIQYSTRVISVLFNTVSFQVIYAAMYFFPLSACQMDVLVDFGGSKFQINGSMLNAADCLGIIVIVPVLDSFVYPHWDRMLGRKVRAVEKYMCGILVSIFAIVVAAVLEIKRRNSPYVSGCDTDDFHLPLAPTPSPTQIDDDGFYSDHDDCYSNCAAQGVKMSAFPVWYMAIPFLLVGTGECLCNIPIYEVCYTQTPPAYRSMAQAVFLFITAVGSMLTGAFTSALGKYITDDLNDGHLEYFYYACILFVGLCIPVNFYCFSYFEEIDEDVIEGMDFADKNADGYTSLNTNESPFAGEIGVQRPSGHDGSAGDAYGESFASRKSRPSRHSGSGVRYSFGGTVMVSE